MSYWLTLSIFAAAVAIISMVNILFSHLDSNRKMIWFAIVTLVPIVGPLVYFMKRKSLLRQ